MYDKDKKKVQKYTVLYMVLGMYFGVLSAFAGALFSLMLKADSFGMTIGIPVGMMTGMSIGMAIGYAKDKRLAENMMEVTRIEAEYESSNMFVYAVDKNGVEKGYKISVKEMKKEKFSVGNRVAEDTGGLLVTLESR